MSLNLRILKETFDAGGNVMIPSFAGRTQEMPISSGDQRTQTFAEYSDFEVYLDSPLAIEATKVFTKYAECFDESNQTGGQGSISGISGLKTSLQVMIETLILSKSRK